MPKFIRLPILEERACYIPRADYDVLYVHIYIYTGVHLVDDINDTNTRA